MRPRSLAAPKVGLCLLWSAGYFGGYFAINHLVPHERRELLDVATRLDATFPFVPELIWPYLLLLLPLIFAPFFAVSPWDEYKGVVRAYAILSAVSFACFVVAPVRVERPEVFPGASFHHWVVAVTYDADRPYNCFPSLHVGLAVLSGLVLAGDRSRCLRYGAPAAAALVSLSVVFVKQHYLADIAAGALVAGVSYLVAVRPARLRAAAAAPAVVASD